MSVPIWRLETRSTMVWTPSTTPAHPASSRRRVSRDEEVLAEIAALDVTIPRGGSWADFARVASSLIGSQAFETMLGMYVRADRSLIGICRLAEGDEKSVHTSSRTTLAAARLCSAAGVVLAHNHPSGRAEASDGDVAFTRWMRSELVSKGIEVHAVLAVTQDPSAFAVAGTFALPHGGSE